MIVEVALHIIEDAPGVQHIQKSLMDDYIYNACIDKIVIYSKKTPLQRQPRDKVKVGVIKGLTL